MPWGAAIMAGASLLAADQQADAAKDASKAQIKANERAAARLEQASGEAVGFYEPYQPIVERGIGESSFLANPQAQYDFLQNSPIFQAALSNANRGTLNRAAAGGRLGAGDTSSELFQNYITAASPLIDRQRDDIGNLLNLGYGVTGARANARLGTASQQVPLITGGGDALAAGIIGSNNAKQQGLENIMGIFGQYMGGRNYGGFGQ